MTVTHIEVEGFRLLENTGLSVEKGTTVIVGRNNSGKTSITTIFERLLKDFGKNIRLEDFSTNSQEMFFTAKAAFEKGQGVSELWELLPKISLICTFEYDPKANDIGTLSPFVIDVNDDSTEAKVHIEYIPRRDAIRDLLSPPELIGKQKPHSQFIKHLKESITDSYKLRVTAVDPTDPLNTKVFANNRELRALLKCDVIRAQRTLEQAKDGDTNVIGRMLNDMFQTASSPNASSNDKYLAAQLKASVEDVESEIQSSFNVMLQALMPAMGLLGFPGLDKTEIEPLTLLDVESLLSDHTKICYKGDSKVNLPEGYYGLGTRHLIYMLLHLDTYHREYRGMEVRPSTHLIFIEEPEAHLHPQMQEVFISQLHEIAKKLSAKYPQEPEWNVQFVITTHSSHIANAADFDAIRYFLKRTQAPAYTEIKDLKKGLKEIDPADKKFLHKYMTLTKCDLYFADKAIFVEGTTERILMPKLIQLTEGFVCEQNKLSSQYLSTVEVGGAYAHLFYPLIDFLELKALVITDIDSVKTVNKKKGKKRVACPVSEGEFTSNASIKNWFPPQENEITLSELVNKKHEDKVTLKRRIAYQIPEAGLGSACGRSYEDALILANPKLFGLRKGSNIEKRAWEKAKSFGKSDTAFRFAVSEPNWNVPAYILEGLIWLSLPNFEEKAEVSEEKVAFEDEQ